MAGLGELLASIGANVGRAGMPQQQNGGGFLSRLLGEPYRGLRDVAGTAGDALLIANDAAPVYAPQKREHQIGEAFAQFVGPELADLARVSPELAYRIRAEQNSGGEGFTLGRDQVRYDAAGNLIAQGPEGTTEPTTLQRDYDFIRQKYGPAAAAEFARYGRGGNPVDITMGQSRYVGPAAGAPGMTPWQEVDAAPQQQQPQGQVVTPQQFGNAMQGLPPEVASGLAQRAGMVVQVSTPEEVQALPAGTTFIAPDGITRVKR